MMFQEKIRQTMSQTFKLLWQFKWYIVGYLIYYSIFIVEYFNPPAADDPVLNYEYTHGAWNYINQEVYIHSMKLYSIIDTLIFFIGTSNMRNHPLLAKIIFLSPWIVMLLGTFVIICEWLWGLLS